MRGGLDWRWRGAVGEWCGRYTHSQDLPQLAVEALLAGWDGKSLTLLAGESATAIEADLGDLLVAAHREMGRTVPTEIEALLDLIRYLAWLTATDQIAPEEGARRIERAALQLMEVDNDAGYKYFAAFGGFDDERSIQYRADGEIDQDIVCAARRLIEGSEPALERAQSPVRSGGIGAPATRHARALGSSSTDAPPSGLMRALAAAPRRGRR